MDIGYNYIASGVRRRHMKKTVAGIELRKTLRKTIGGRAYHRWVGSMAGLAIVLDPILGPRSGKVNGWSYSGNHPGMGTVRAVQMGVDDKGRPRYLAGRCNTLRDAVIEAQHKAVEARRFEKGLKPGEGI